MNPDSYTNIQPVPEKRSLISRFGDICLEAVDQYAIFCDSIVSTTLMASDRVNYYLNSFLNDLTDNILAVFSVPIAILCAVFRVVYFIFNVFMFPLRCCQYLGTHYPITTIFFLIITICTYFMIRKLTRQTFVNYFLHTIVPYAVSIVYTVFGLFFPQVHTLSRLLQAVLHPIRWILGLAEQVDRRAGPIRRTVEIFSPSRGDQPEIDRALSIRETTNNERVQCCICISNDKSVVLRPCNHLCLCDVCLRAVLRQPTPKCPICRSDIESHMNVFL